MRINFTEKQKKVLRCFKYPGEKLLLSEIKLRIDLVSKSRNIVEKLCEIGVLNKRDDNSTEKKRCIYTCNVDSDSEDYDPSFKKEFNYVHCSLMPEVIEHQPPLETIFTNLIKK